MPLSQHHKSESTQLHAYLRVWYVIFGVKKEKPPFYFNFMLIENEPFQLTMTIVSKYLWVVFKQIGPFYV